MLPTLAAVMLSGLAGPQMTHWEVHSKVVLPRPMWLVQGVVLQPRVTEIELDLALACGTPEGVADAREVRCIIEDSAIRAAAMPGDEQGADTALKEADERLTGAEVRLTLKKGRVQGVLLNIGPTRGIVRRTTRARDENLRLLVSRAVSGFDLERSELAVDAEWSQRRTWIAQLPAARGTLSRSPLIHQVHAGADGEGYRVVTGGKPTLSVQSLFHNGTPAPEDTFRGEIRAEAQVSAEGELLSRRWALLAEPTPSSGGDQGVLGLPYLHEGSLKRIDDASQAQIGASEIIDAKHRQPSALQADRSLGIPPVGWRGW